MSKISLMLMAILMITGCLQDDVKNTYSISGKLAYSGDILFEGNYTLNLLSDDQLMATSTEPNFSFNGLEEGRNYTLQIQSEASRNGLSTIDIVEIGKYLDGTLSLDSFQKLAADANRDNQINQADIDAITNCIVGGPCVGWRFASADYDGNGAGYADPYSITNLTSDVVLNFIPIKLGDVNGTIRPH